MYYNVELKRCILLQESEIEEDVIKENNFKYKNVKGFCDQYIVNQSKLVGIITDIDFQKYIKGQVKNVKDIINYNPIIINKTEVNLIGEYFKFYPNVWSIPVVDDEHNLIYVVERLNMRAGQFWKYDSEFLHNYGMIRKRIQNKMHEIHEKYPNCIIRIITDMNQKEKKMLGVNNICVDSDSLCSMDTENVIVILAYKFNYNTSETIGKLLNKKIKFYGLNITMRSDTCHYYENDRCAHEVLYEEVLKNGSYFDMNDFENIFQALQITKKLSGAYVEIGTFHGDSARAALSYMQKKHINKKAYFIDTYEGFTYSESFDSADAFWNGTHETTSIDFVKERLNEFCNYELIKANIIKDDIPNDIDKIAVCNVDVDMYEAVYTALVKVHSRIIEGGG